MKCKKCKSMEATIHVANVGDFCLECHNDYMAKLLAQFTRPSKDE
ncbi:hypothetical protein [Desulfosporosinus sp. BICA1-9]|nr:hypothetical protein [Desulfosporosinus sp. BICA1-9]